MKFLVVTVLFYGLFRLSAAADEPALPVGLGGSDEPELPAELGLEKSTPTSSEDDESSLPVLPEGLRDDEKASPASPIEEDGATTRKKSWVEMALPLEISGFWEARGGTRVVNDAHERQTSIAETRLQLEIEKNFNRALFSLVTDFIYDDVADTHDINLNTGRGWIDLRSANLVFSPASFMDIKAGRQILTWGTGDLLFINDLFPKDWNAFFIGRDEEYLKAPSDAVKASVFSGWTNLDIVYTPEFDADRFIDGRRISYYSPQLGAIAGRNAIIDANRPSDGELALRLYRYISAYELAAYFYSGHWKSPGGFDPIKKNLALFPKLNVFGGSIRGPLGDGIGNIEVGYYDSDDDNKGGNPFINNSEFRVLAGYEQEIAKNLTLGTQYYLEHMFDHHNYLRTLPAGLPVRKENRHQLTVRLTFLTHSQNTTWSLFTYYSPSAQDYYLRPKVSYRIDDHWTAELGGNIFGGKNDYTFFGQFQDNSNIYVSVRYGF